mmetsp:Transcript_32114/g.31865  ORF Transcript_32114/g.31865 Transcript_32114/m.31865 type:complete len:238 (-) Transcript_32114:36-749(-)
MEPTTEASGSAGSAEVPQFDICIILDCTGSMGSSFPQVKEAITSIVNMYMPRGVSTNFAIVGYTDHAGDSGNLDGNNPVTIYPPSKNINDFVKDDAIQFLNNLVANGGGSKYGEAMIDGMYNANHLVYRPNTPRMYFIIGDDTPHGSEFHPNTQYPNGCACGHDWRQLLREMKEQEVLLKFVKLNDIMNKTAELFEAEYGEDNMETFSQACIKNLSSIVADSVGSVIEYYLEQARNK